MWRMPRQRQSQRLRMAPERTLEAQALQVEAERRAKELAVINNVQTALVGELNMQCIYDTVGDKLRKLYGPTDLSIRVFDASTGLVHFPYTCERGERTWPEPLATIDIGFNAHVRRTRESLVLNEDFATAVGRFGDQQIDGATRKKSAALVPVLWDGEVRGMLCVSNYEREHAFQQSDVELIEAFASIMSLALQNAQRFEENQRRVRESAALAEVGRDISATLDVASLMDSIATHAKNLLSSDSSAIFVPSQGEDEKGGEEIFRAIVAKGAIAA